MEQVKLRDEIEKVISETTDSNDSDLSMRKKLLDLLEGIQEKHYNILGVNFDLMRDVIVANTNLKLSNELNKFIDSQPTMIG